MKTLPHTWLVFILTTLLTQASEKINLELTPTTCLPGDLIELTATSTTPTYQEFTLSIPKNKNLQLIAKETSPVTLENNHYTQTTLYIFQAIAPGQHTLTNITATKKLTSSHAPIKLNPITLTVSTYPPKELDQDLTPATFPTKKTKSQKNPYLWLFFIFPFLLCFYIINTNTLKSTPPTEPAQPLSLETLKAELTKGTIPETLCFQLLEQQPNNLTEPQKSLIEKALYNPTFTPTDLLNELNALNKEDQP